MEKNDAKKLSAKKPPEVSPKAGPTKQKFPKTRTYFYDVIKVAQPIGCHL